MRFRIYKQLDAEGKGKKKPRYELREMALDQAQEQTGKQQLARNTLGGYKLNCDELIDMHHTQNKQKQTLCPLFMDGVQRPQGYRATTRRHFTFYH